jgi:hypothetical protein
VVERRRATGVWYEVAATDDDTFARHIFMLFTSAALAQGRIVPMRLRDTEDDQVIATMGETGD